MRSLLLLLLWPVPLFGQVPTTPELYRNAYREDGFHVRALREAFAPAFETENYVLVMPTYGTEFAVGFDLRRLLVLSLDSSLLRTAMVPCEKARETCRRWSHEAAVRVRPRLDTLALDAWTMEVLHTLLYETLARAPAKRRDNMIESHGTTYLFRSGGLTAEAWSPRGPSVASALVRLVWMMREAPAQPDAMRVRIRTTADSLLAVVLQRGGDEPLSSIREMPMPRALSGCEAHPPPEPYDYCWRAELDDDPFPEWLVAHRQDTTYTYRILDTKNDPRAFPFVRVLPGVVPLLPHSDTPRDQYAGPPMRPWEIVDLSRALRPGEVRLYAGVRRAEGAAHVGLELEGGQGRVGTSGASPWAGLMGWRTLDELFEAATR